MDLKTLADNFGILLDAPDAIGNLKALITRLAFLGQLLPQKPDDEPVEALLDRIEHLRRNRYGTTLSKDDDDVYPPSGLPSIPPTWKWARLGTIQQFVNGFAFKSTDYQTQGVGIIRIGDIVNGEISQDGMVFVPTKYISELKHEMQVRPGDLVIAMSGATTGKVGFNRTSNTFLLNQRVGKFILFEVSEHYLYYFLTTQVAENLRRSAGSAIPNLSTEQINNTWFPLAPVQEQHRIVAKVDHLMQLCDELEQKKEKVAKTRSRLNTVSLEKLVSARNAHEFDECWGRVSCNFDLLFRNYDDLNELRRSTLTLAAMGKLTAVSSQNGTGLDLIENLARKQSKSFDIKIATKSHHEVPFALPEHWTWARFDHVAEIASNLVKPNDYLDLPHVAPDSIEKHTGRLLRYQTVREDHVISANHHFFSEQILYSKIRPNLGKAIISSFEGLCSADMYPLNSFINSRFLLLYILSPVFLRMAVKKDTRVAMPKINQAELSEILVPVPPTIEQEAIVNKADKILNLCNDLAKRLAVVDSLHSFVAKSAFGSLCDSNTTIDPANSSPSQGQEACYAE